MFTDALHKAGRQTISAGFPWNLKANVRVGVLILAKVKLCDLVSYRPHPAVAVF